MEAIEIVLVIMAVAAGIGCLFLPVYIVVRCVVDRRSDRKDAHRQVRSAIDKITADGIIEGPKGRYVPRKRRGPLTDGSTSPPKHGGYYNHPWP